MKKFKTMMAMMLALVSMCVVFSSCSSDDDDNNGAGSSATAEQVVGDSRFIHQLSGYDRNGRDFYIRSCYYED